MRASLSLHACKPEGEPTWADFAISMDAHWFGECKRGDSRTRLK